MRDTLNHSNIESLALGERLLGQCSFRGPSPGSTVSVIPSLILYNCSCTCIFRRSHACQCSTNTHHEAMSCSDISDIMLLAQLVI